MHYHSFFQLIKLSADFFFLAVAYESLPCFFCLGFFSMYIWS